MELVKNRVEMLRKVVFSARGEEWDRIVCGYYASRHWIIEQSRLILMAQHMSDHSSATFDKPRPLNLSLNLRNPRTCFIQLKTGSTIPFLCLYNFLPFGSDCFSSRDRCSNLASAALMAAILVSRRLSSAGSSSPLKSSPNSISSAASSPRARLMISAISASSFVSLCILWSLFP